MNQEEYFTRFYRYMRTSEENETILPSVIRSKVDDIYSMYGGKEINEEDIKRDAEIFLLGMEAGRLTGRKIENLRINTGRLQGLLKTIRQNRGPGEIDSDFSRDH